MNAKNLTLIALLFVSFLSFSQESKKFIDSGSITEQFDNLYENSNNYQDYKVVRKNWLIKLKSNVSDTLKISKNELLNRIQTIKIQQATIDSLQTILNTSNETISELNSQTESISFLGIPFKKNLFKSIVIGIVSILILLLIFFIAKTNRSSSLINEAKTKLKETEEEYENHRKTALEREQKVRRQLQDELNKQKKE
jgi:predicted PurR-regulated permease PerM